MKKINFNKKILLIPIILGLFVLGWYVKEEKAKNEELIRVFEERQEKQGSEKIDTSDWKTYRNKKFGFQISYPKKWKITTNNYWHSGASSFEFAITKKKKCSDSVYRCKEKIVGFDITPGLWRNHTIKQDNNLLDFSADFLDDAVIHYHDFGPQGWSGCEFEIKPRHYSDITRLRFLFYQSDISFRDEEDLQIRKEILKSFRFIKKLEK
ncbi:MAG: hypothetical protein U9O20_05005 [Patescibacteria group bacterium]|nr:hypothetical protein [Patescibacteria group bacterium]